MKLEKRGIIILSLILLLVLAGISYYFGIIKKNCKDEECFDDAIKFCSPVKYDRPINNNVYRYEISRSLGENCKMEISLESSSTGTDFETREKLEGKSMKCYIPKVQLYSIDLKEVENLLGYCTGPLKEGIYEIIIKKMYGIILSNLGDILGDVQVSLIKKI